MPLEPTRDSALADRDDQDATQVVAQRLRQLRKASGQSLRTMAEATGMSASFLSQLERGLTGASTSTLIRIANFYGTSISELFAGADDPSGKVLRADKRPMLPAMNGQRKALLSRRPLTHLETYITEFDPGGSTGDDLYTHGDSLEMLLVLEGQVQLDLDGQIFDLFKGDSIEYLSSTPHRVANNGAQRAEVVFIISPPTPAAVPVSSSAGRLKKQST